jgi:hypothetical protein
MLRMKFWRERRLAAASAASRLSGKPPRSHSSSAGTPAASANVSGDSSGCAMRPASDSPDWRSRSIEADPSSRVRPCRGAGAARAVDLAARHGKQLRRALHFVQDQQLVAMVGQIQLGLRQPGAIGLGLEVQVQRRARGGQRLAHRECQRGLARLTRPGQRHGRRFAKGRDHAGLEFTLRAVTESGSRIG